MTPNKTMKGSKPGPFLRIGRWVLWLLLAGSSLVVLAYTFENWRGARTWAKTFERYEASGGSLDWKDLLPQRKHADEDNFCAIPELNGIATPSTASGGEQAEQLRQAFRSANWKDRASKAWLEWSRRVAVAHVHSTGETVDFREFARLLIARGLPVSHDEPESARAILEAIDAEFPWMAALDAATGRREAQFLPPASELIEVSEPLAFVQPHLSTVREICKWLVRRMVAATHCGDVERARKSLVALFRLLEASSDSPSLIGQLVAETQLAMMTWPLWESLHAHLWEAEQLQSLQGELERVRLVETWTQSLSGEIVVLSETLDRFKHASTKEMTEVMGLYARDEGFDTARAALIMKGMPDGWFDQSRALLLSEWQQAQDSWSSGSFEAMKAQWQTSRELRKPLSWQQTSWTHRPLRWLWAPALSFVDYRRLAWLKGRLGLMRLAVALERAYLKEGRYPGQLEDLLPEFLSSLPEEPIGQGWRYRVSGSGETYTLYSVGVDERDDGGEILAHPVKDKGDWVWVP